MNGIFVKINNLLLHYNICFDIIDFKLIHTVIGSSRFVNNLREPSDGVRRYLLKLNSSMSIWSENSSFKRLYRYNIE